ncbi:MAG: DUF2723 domain-containing protein [Candidatus Aureabacteria bacterium]|nr:DUF2723 domain-containing protein [Candidatus Auribacterota bacterium]
MQRHKYLPRALAGFCFIISLSIYLQTMLPGVGGYGDTSKFQFIGRVAGLPHASGFPTYLFINALFARIPWGTLAWRINFMSALFGALTVAMLSLLVYRLTANVAAALIAPLFLAFSLTYWSTCLIAEVYTFAFFFISVTIYWLILWKETMLRQWFYLACLIYAISFGNHLMVMSLFPSFVFIVLATDRTILRQPRALLSIAAIILLGAVQYLYLPLRTAQHPSYCDNSVPMKDLFWFATGAPFKQNIFPLTMRQVLTIYVPIYARTLRSQLGIPGIVLAAAGTIIAIRRKSVWGIFFILFYFTTVSLYLNGPTMEQHIYFVPATLAIVVLTGFVFTIGNGAARTALIAVALLTLARTFASNLPVVNLSGKTEYCEAADSVFEAVKSESIILSPNYQWTEAFLYKILGEEKRKGDSVCVLHHWEPGKLSDYREGKVPTWNPYRPSGPLPGSFNLYLFSLERESPTLRQIEKAGWRAHLVLSRENPLIERLKALEPHKLLLVTVRDEGLTILSDEGFDAVRALGLRTQVSRRSAFGWASANAVTRLGDRWHGPQQFKYRPVAITRSSGDKIIGTHYSAPVSIALECAGYGRGDRNVITVGGERVSKTKTGMNLCILDLATGRIDATMNIPPAELGTLRSVYLYELLPPAESGGGSPGGR